LTLPPTMWAKSIADPSCACNSDFKSIGCFVTAKPAEKNGCILKIADLAHAGRFLPG
jgi:hypothetical protein